MVMLLLWFGCNPKDQTTVNVKTDSPVMGDTLQTNKPSHPDTVTSSKIYANERFKDVTVKKVGEHAFTINGKAQIFEANFAWVIEDGHDELQQGHHMTDAGAPEWGNFSFTVDAPKTNPNTTLHLILFEASPKDGSRQYELPILLY